MEYLLAAGSSLYDLAFHAAVFFVVLGVLVFVHEYGHYLAARQCDVHVEAFSIGFGRELWGWTDKRDTRWRLSLVPLGGYVRLFGQGGTEDRFHAEGAAEEGAEAALPPPLRGRSFAEKSVYQRAWIVAAGPLANFTLAVFVFAIMFMTVGQPMTSAVITGVQPDSAAERAGFQVQDRVVEIDGRPILRFEDLQRLVRLRPEQPLEVKVERAGRIVSLGATPDRREIVDRFGTRHELGVLGISGGIPEVERRDPVTALWQGVAETWRMTDATLTAVWQMIAGTRGTEELGGPLRIAQLSGRVATDGVVQLIGFIALLSVNLGLINLFPIPILDGGHLLFYAFEAVFGRPLSARAQEYGFRIGLMLIASLFVFVTWNDLRMMRVVEWVVHLLG